MRQSLARFSASVSSVHALSWADFIIATPAFKLSVHTAAGMSEMAEINAPARTANNLRIVFSRRRRVSLARLYGNYDERPEDGQAWPP